MFVLSNVKSVYSGAGDQPQHPLARQDIVVRNGRIDSLAPHDPTKNYGADFRVLDCSNVHVAPGLIDCHSHITLVGIDDEAITRANSQAGLLYAEKILYRTLVEGGVTTIREIGGATHFSSAWSTRG